MLRTWVMRPNSSILTGNFMYGFNAKNTPLFLIGCEIIQVCVGSHEVIINFDNRRSVTIMSIDVFKKYNFVFLNSIISFDQEYIGRKVKLVNLNNAKTISIVLENDNIIYLCDDSDEFESVIFQDASRVYSI